MTETVTTVVCDHPNWHTNRRSSHCQRRTALTCEACLTPTCGTHLRRLLDGRRVCMRWRCMADRLAAQLAAESNEGGNL